MLGCAINGQKRMFDLLSHLLGNVKPMLGQPFFVLINIRGAAKVNNSPCYDRGRQGWHGRLSGSDLGQLLRLTRRNPLRPNLNELQSPLGLVRSCEVLSPSVLRKL
jgi:hypothetical protein